MSICDISSIHTPPHYSNHAFSAHSGLSANSDPLSNTPNSTHSSLQENMKSNHVVDDAASASSVDSDITNIVAMTIEKEVASERKKLQMEMRQKKKSKDLQSRKATIERLQTQLESSRRKNIEDHNKIEGLHSTVQEMKRKLQDCDSTIKRKANVEDELIKARAIIEQKAIEVDLFSKKFSGEHSRLLDLEKTNDTLEVELKLIKRENEAFEEKSELLKGDIKNLELLLSEEVAKNKIFALQVTEAHRNSKAEFDIRMTKEIELVRKESKDAFYSYRDQVDRRLEHEIKALSEQKYNNTAIADLESSLRGCRSELQIKCDDFSRLEVDLRETRSKLKKMAEEMEVQKSDLTFLQFERVRSLETKHFLGASKCPILVRCTEFGEEAISKHATHHGTTGRRSSRHNFKVRVK